MPVARTLAVLWVALAGLSLLGLVLAFGVTVAAALRTVHGAAGRARRRNAGLGPLAAAFPAARLARLDEAMERAAAEEEGRASAAA